MVLVLISSVLYGLHLRDGVEADREVMHANRDAMTDISLIHMESEYYPNESGINNRSYAEKLASERSNSQEKLYRSYINRRNAILTAPALIAMGTSIYPLTPGGRTVFPFKDGYIASVEYPTTTAEILYRRNKLNELAQRANKTNMSYEDFKETFNRVNSVEYPDRRLIESFSDENFTQPGFLLSLNARVSDIVTGRPNERLATKSRVKQHILENTWKEIQFRHFIPSFIASFVFYYLISGIILAGVPRVVDETERMIGYAEPDHSIVISAVAYTLLINLGLILLGGVMGAYRLFNVGNNIGMAIIFHLIIGTGYFFISGHFNSGRRWLKIGAAVSGVSVGIFTVGYLMDYIYWPDYLVVFSLAVMVDVAIISFLCWRIEQKIRRDFEENRI